MLCHVPPVENCHVPLLAPVNPVTAMPRGTVVPSGSLSAVPSSALTAAPAGFVVSPGIVGSDGFGAVSSTGAVLTATCAIPPVVENAVVPAGIVKMAPDAP